MNVLSLFDGKSSGYTALELAGFEVGNYYSAEVDKYAIKVSDAIHPNQTRLGDVMNWHFWQIDWASIDLVLGGFPCQAWSMAGKQQGDKDERGKLFWYMLDIMQYVLHHNPNAKFLIENVKMKKEFEQYITYHTEQVLGKVEKHLINSALVSAQNRQRYYWCNWYVPQPDDRGILLADILETNGTGWIKNRGKMKSRNDKPQCIDANYHKGIDNHGQRTVVFDGRIKGITENDRGYRPHKGDKAKSGISELGRILKPTANKTDTVTTSHAPKLAVNDDITDLKYRKLTTRECFRLQTVPEPLIDKILNCGVSNTQLYKIAGNGWTDEVIAHIFSYMK